MLEPISAHPHLCSPPRMAPGTTTPSPGEGGSSRSHRLPRHDKKSEWKHICLDVYMGREMTDFAKLFRALADPNRLRILNILSHQAMCVCDLQAVLGLSQPFISRHLAYLRRA